MALISGLIYIFDLIHKYVGCRIWVLKGVPLMNSYGLRVLLVTIMLCTLLMSVMLAGYSKAASPDSLSLKKIFYTNSILRDEEKKKDVDSLIELAKSFLGVRYAYGGAGPSSFDCSGLTMYVMGKFGIDLPHSAREQSRYGTVVSKDQLKPGDLVFFGTSRGRRITHVGLYTGDNCFIHAASNGVSINNLDESYYRNCYVTAVRLIE